MSALHAVQEQKETTIKLSCVRSNYLPAHMTECLDTKEGSRLAFSHPGSIELHEPVASRCAGYRLRVMLERAVRENLEGNARKSMSQEGLEGREDGRERGRARERKSMHEE